MAHVESELRSVVQTRPALLKIVPSPVAEAFLPCGAVAATMKAAPSTESRD
jgi:hypothetical protein